jgi:excisionase family DNA binding protein
MMMIYSCHVVGVCVMPQLSTPLLQANNKAAEPLSVRSPEEWLTASEAAAYLKVKPRTILQWAKDGKIHGHVLSGTKRCTWRFLRSELDAILTTPSAALMNGRIQ